MSVTRKALFTIERNLHQDLTLAQVARACGVSRFHLAHAFGEATGCSVMQYLRGRRLSVAARALADGAADILALALETGYGSHEAFSRAFKAQFGRTPEQVRQAASVDGMALVDPIPYPETRTMTLQAPRIESVGELRFVGLGEHVPYRQMHRIPGLWARFRAEAVAAIPHRLPGMPAGIAVSADDDGVDYLCAVPVSDFGPLPAGCRALTLAPATYAVFAHDDHVSRLGETYEAIWNEGLPASGRVPLRAPSLERHNPTFDPRTGMGGVTVWIPVED